MKRIALAASCCSLPPRRRRGAPGGRTRGRRTARARDSITVSGNGSVPRVPTTAVLSLGVDVRAATAKAALAANAREMRQVIDAVKSAGGRQVGTQSVSLSQVLGQNGEPNGFAASNVVSATVDVDHAGAVIDAAVGAGANQVNGPRCRWRTGEALPAGLEGGRCRCAPERRDTRRCGRTLARQGDVGRRERGCHPGADVREGRSLRCATPVEAGTQQTSASVTVTFALG